MLYTPVHTRYIRAAHGPGAGARPWSIAVATGSHDYHDTTTGVLAASLAKRAAGYTRLGFPDLAASLIHPVRVQPGISPTHSLDNQCAIARNPGPAPRGSTTAQLRATAARRVPPTTPRAQSIRTSPSRDRNQGVPHRERLR
jgi:hypothetical protein